MECAVTPPLYVAYVPKRLRGWKSMKAKIIKTTDWVASKIRVVQITKKPATSQAVAPGVSSPFLTDPYEQAIAKCRDLNDEMIQHERVKTKGAFC